MMNAEEIIEATKSEDRLDVGQSVTLTASIYIRHFVPLVFIPFFVFLVFGLLDFANNEWEGAAYSISVTTNNVFQLLSIQITYGLGTYYSTGHLLNQNMSSRGAIGVVGFLMKRMVIVSAVAGVLVIVATLLSLVAKQSTPHWWVIGFAYLFFNVGCIVAAGPIIAEKLSLKNAFRRAAKLSIGSLPEVFVFALIVLGAFLILAAAIPWLGYVLLGGSYMAFVPSIWFAVVFSLLSVASTVAYLQLRQISEKSMVAVE